MKNFLQGILNRNIDKCSLGRVADYIPGLSAANKENLGICLITNDGEITSVGDYDVKFTLQSISKPLSLMLAILDQGEKYVFSKVGMEPTGDPFNSIRKLETGGMRKPFNPMINAGAIEVCSMIKGKTSEDKFNRVLNFIKVISENDKLDINNNIYLGEKKTGNRNRSMGYFLKGEGLIQDDVEDVLDVYFKQCSIEVTAVDLAKIGMFLSRGGVTSKGERIVSEHVCTIVKTLMITCGMYDGSGEFAVKVGVPSKSGVGGGIMSVAPGKMGIGVFGPALDIKGNSIAGISVLEEIASNLNLSIF
ncbi:glutaminase A [Cetobacterium sp. 2A]|uniref:glutaminase A n=1 Tax=unclassified Cetobacterium TaxID=2630983 RepID=UPI00163C4643|nr:glutaminase A [Cetobacterium sp. 2A]MBC2855050.1 glutaminase A [Cetobacterium sp. 2A]